MNASTAIDGFDKDGEAHELLLRHIATSDFRAFSLPRFQIPRYSLALSPISDFLA